MQDQVAVSRDITQLRRLLLLFDKIGLPNLDDLLELTADGLEAMDIRPCPSFNAELTNLVSKDLIFQANLDEDTTKRLAKESSQAANLDDEVALAKTFHSRDDEFTSLVLKEIVLKGQRDGILNQFTVHDSYADVETRLKALHEWRTDMETRLIAARLRSQGVEAYPILDLRGNVDHRSQASKSPLVEIALTGLPMVGSDVPLPEFLEFRADPKSRRLLLSLRRWIRHLSKEKLSPNELAEEIEWNISEYQEHMRLHKIRATSALLKIILKTPLEIVENLLRLRLSKSIDAAFEISEIYVSLLQEELEAPGREVAYLVKARERFRQ